MSEATSTARLTLRTKLGYGVGDLGSGLMFSAVNFYFLYFLTDVAHLAPYLAGLAVMLGKIYDAITDPLMGHLSDRTRTRLGRRRPFMLLAALPFGLAFALAWMAPAITEPGRFAYALGSFVLLCTFYTVFEVPYASLTADLTRDYDQRTSLTSYRMLFSILGTLIAGAATLVIVGLAPTERAGFPLMGYVYGGIIALSSLACFMGTRERPVTADEDATLPLATGIRVALGNRPFRMALAIYFLTQTAMAVVSALLIYYLRDVTGLGGQTPLVMGLLMVMSILALPLWVALSARWGKARAFALGIGVQALVLLLFAGLPPGAPIPVYLLTVVAGVCTATHFVFPWSMVPDVVEYDQLTTGQRRAGTFYGIWLFTQKVSAAAGVGLTGLLLSWYGYQAGVDQTPGTILGLRLSIGPVAVALLVLAGYLLLRYPINRSAHEAVRARLAGPSAERPTPPVHPG